MEKTVTLEEALKRIEELEKENASGWQFIMILLLGMRAA